MTRFASRCPRWRKAWRVSGNVLADIDVSTNSRGDWAAAWGTNPAGPGGQILYQRVSNVPRASATSAQANFDDVVDERQLTDVTVEIDNARNTVAAFGTTGAGGGEFNVLDVSTLNGEDVEATWSPTQDLSRFCEPNNQYAAGPSLSTSANRGVLISWACGNSAAGSNVAPGLIWTRSFG